MSSSNPLLGKYDSTQIALMAEECLLVTPLDQVTGHATKKFCHLLENIKNGSALHRAFSVFLFSEDRKLLMQQRAMAKITYPGLWTNTCCSHPLNLPSELEEAEALGVKCAAIRKLNHELGINAEDVPLEKFNFIGRIKYMAENIPQDDTWGEFEIDYLLFIQTTCEVVPNYNEVMDYKYVSRDEVSQFVDSHKVTPWFRLIYEKFLLKWWDDLESISSHADSNNIHDFC